MKVSYSNFDHSLGVHSKNDGVGTSLWFICNSSLKALHMSCRRHGDYFCFTLIVPDGQEMIAAKHIDLNSRRLKTFVKEVN